MQLPAFMSSDGSDRTLMGNQCASGSWSADAPRGYLVLWLPLALATPRSSALVWPDPDAVSAWTVSIVCCDPRVRVRTPGMEHRVEIVSNEGINRSRGGHRLPYLRPRARVEAPAGRETWPHIQWRPILLLLVNSVMPADVLSRVVPTACLVLYQESANSSSRTGWRAVDPRERSITAWQDNSHATAAHIRTSRPTGICTSISSNARLSRC
jgi:hypothetical protein